MPVTVRDADEAEIARLAQLWYDGWQDAHAKILPAELRRLRTLQSFSARLSRDLGRVRVAGPVGTPLGFCMTKGAELYQLYVAAGSRGTGVAAALMADAEAKFREGDIEVAWLACAIGNERAARFYEKCGWRRVGIVTSQLPTGEGIFPLDVWRYEKVIAAPNLEGRR